MALSFSDQIDKEWRAIGYKASLAISGAGKEAWKVARDSTPAPPGGGPNYKRTGNLRAGWRISADRRASYVPRPGVKAKPKVPVFKFRVTKHKRIYIWNNVPYAFYVDQGLGGGQRKAHNMLLKASIKFEKELQKRFDAI